MDNADLGVAFAGAQKRRFSDAADAPLHLDSTQPKRKRELLLQHNLLSFCDELLFEIFKYLDSWSILAVMNCSPRFENLLLDHRFWHNIDLSNSPLPLGILEEILGRATEKTHTIKICGPPSSQHVAGEFKQFTCTLTGVFPKVATQLQILELQGVSLDFEYIHISEFPASLKRLKLKDCSVKVGEHVKSIFHTIEKQLVDLEDLSIEDNNWFEPYYIMALSKLPSLRRLSLKGCEMMCKFVPYGSMAARFGFQKLEVLDLRLTPINNSDLQCFGAIESLKEILLESPPNLTIKESPEKESPASDKKSNGNANQNDSAAPTQSESQLNDDEPSTSRAALQNLRASNNAQDNGNTSADAPKPSDTFNSDNCNERKSVSDSERYSSSSPPITKRAQCKVDDDDDDDDDDNDDDTSSDEPPLNAPTAAAADAANPNAPARSPLVVISLPGVAPEQPPAAAGNAGPPTPRAYIYVPEASNAAGEAEEPQQQPNMGFIMQQMDIHLQHWRGNQPAHSRFLPRRDQVIYMNPAVLVMNSRRARGQPRGNYEQVVQHPMFWNMLDPLDRDYARRIRNRPHSSSVLPPQYYVSDRAIYSFGRAANPVQPDVIWIRNINRSPNNRLERIILRNYPHITNHALEHLVQCSPNLIYVDVSGTSITIAGVRNFKKLKPDCEVVAAHLTVPDEEEEEEQLTQVEPATDDANDERQPAPSSPPPPPPAQVEEP